MREKINCDICNKEFTPRTKSVKRCSAECRKKAKHIQYKNAKEGNQFKQAKRNCDVCGKEFIAKNYQQLRCSKKCSKEHKIDKTKDWIDKARKRNFNFLLGYMEKKECNHCGEKDIRLFDFDHINPNNKIECISTMAHDCKPILEIRKELEKCQILCANCHRLKTYKERGITKFDGYLPLDIDFEKGE